RSLENQKPTEMEKSLRFRTDERMAYGADGRMLLPEHSGIIKLMSNGSDPSGGGWRFRVEFWYPGDDNGLLAPYEAWFWKATRLHFNQTPVITEERKHIEGSADIPSPTAPAVVPFARFLPRVY